MTNETENRSPSPWRIGLESARANLVPGIALWTAACALVLSYYFVPGVAEALRPLAAWQEEHRVAGMFVSRALVCGLVPGLFLLAIPSLRPRRLWATVGANCLWWGAMGVVVGSFYYVQLALFGDGHDFATLLLKTCMDQFVYTVFFASPLTALYSFWQGRDFSFARTRAELPRRWVRELVAPNLVSNWALWIPALFAIYAFPAPLQVHVSSIVCCFWALMCMQIGLRSGRK